MRTGWSNNRGGRTLGDNKAINIKIKQQIMPFSCHLVVQDKRICIQLCLGCYLLAVGGSTGRSRSRDYYLSRFSSFHFSISTTFFSSLLPLQQTAISELADISVALCVWPHFTHCPSPLPTRTFYYSCRTLVHKQLLYLWRDDYHCEWYTDDNGKTLLSRWLYSKSHPHQAQRDT